MLSNLFCQIRSGFITLSDTISIYYFVRYNHSIWLTASDSFFRHYSNIISVTCTSMSGIQKPGW